ncbi:hypothetical protein [Streptomyces sp. SID3343]|uniref:hypothetical protein n=1 Tax=Streptomyces sp. SID3343 TaxID=2690260 RepID=UPI001370D418|nr:hypothetical protein [Streptomyces sp. SID3343]
MSRRVSLPGADELFRTTGGAMLRHSAGGESGESQRTVPAQASPPGANPDSAERHESSGEAGGSGETEHPVPGPVRREAPTPSGASSMSQAAHSAAAMSAAAGVDPNARPAHRRTRAQRRPSGRERHDEKITVYVSAEELMDLEHARLSLRGDYGLAVDRGRIVREAVAVVLADLEARGEASILVRRLRGS